MNIRVIFLGALCASLISSMPIKANTTQLEARPIVYFNGVTLSSPQEGQAFWSHEIADLISQQTEICKRQGNMDQSELQNSLQTIAEAINKVQQKAYAIAIPIAKRLGAISVVQYYSCNKDMIYIDPEYDITREVIDTLNKSYTPNKQVSERISPQDMLHKAILNDSAEEISRAVKAGANINHGKSGESPLSWAVKYKRSKAIKCLLQKGATASNSMFQESLQLNDISSAILLAINCGANLNAVYSNGFQNATLLQLAAGKSDFEYILLLIRSGASFSGYTMINGRSRSLMGITVSHCHDTTIGLELIQKLINNNYNVNDIWTEYINFGGNLFESNERLELFIKNGANLNQIIKKEHPQGCTWTPLFKAIDMGSLQSVKILLDAGANINQKANPYPDRPPLCPNGPQTPLSFAINKGATAIAELLRERGASL